MNQCWNTFIVWRPCIASICRYIRPPPPVLFFLFNVYIHTYSCQFCRASAFNHGCQYMCCVAWGVGLGACTGCEGAGCSTHDALVTGFCDSAVPDTCECTTFPHPSLTIQCQPLGLIDAFRVIVHFYIYSVHIT
jgi:hypothetical protein